MNVETTDLPCDCFPVLAGIYLEIRIDQVLHLLFLPVIRTIPNQMKNQKYGKQYNKNRIKYQWYRRHENPPNKIIY